MKFLKPAILTACVLVLGACLPFGGSKSELGVAGVESHLQALPGTAVSWQLVIDEPVAIDPLTSTRIVLKPSGMTYGVLRGVRWTDSATEMVQTVLVHAFEDSARIVGVGRTSTGVRGDFALLTELRDFQAEYDEAGDAAHVTISAKLVRYASNEVLAARVFATRVKSEGRGVAAVVTAFQQALDELLPQIVSWTLEVGEANHASAHPRVPA